MKENLRQVANSANELNRNLHRKWIKIFFTWPLNVDNNKTNLGIHLSRATF